MGDIGSEVDVGTAAMSLITNPCLCFPATTRDPDVYASAKQKIADPIPLEKLKPYLSAP